MLCFRTKNNIHHFYILITPTPWRWQGCCGTRWRVLYMLHNVTCQVCTMHIHIDIYVYLCSKVVHSRLVMAAPWCEPSCQACTCRQQGFRSWLPKLITRMIRCPSLLVSLPCLAWPGLALLFSRAVPDARLFTRQPGLRNVPPSDDYKLIQYDIVYNILCYYTIS